MPNLTFMPKPYQYQGQDYKSNNNTTDNVDIVPSSRGP